MHFEGYFLNSKCNNKSEQFMVNTFCYSARSLSKYYSLVSCYNLVMLSGDGLSYHRDMPFSTYDHDNSIPGDCASRLSGGWWYKACINANINGMYELGVGYSLIVWIQWMGLNSLKLVEMKIRPADFVLGKYESDYCTCQCFPTAQRGSMTMAWTNAYQECVCS